jgi:hypothetical protein
MAWTNSDGLRVEFGTERTKGAQVGATISNDGSRKVIRATLEASRMVIGGGLIGDRAHVFIPAGSYIESALFVVTEAFDSGSTATLDIGLANADATYTNLDEDGIDVAVAETAIDTAGKEVVCDGALIGTILTTGGYLSYDVDTAVYTTGKGYLLVTIIPTPYPDQGAD